MPARIATPTREAVLRDSEAGLPIDAIAERHGIGTATVKRIRREARLPPVPKVRKRRPGGGRKPSLNADQKAAVVALIMENPRWSLKQLRVAVQEQLGLLVSESTLTRALNSAGLSKRQLARDAKAASPEPQTEWRYGPQHRRKGPDHSHRRGYPTDLTDPEWEKVRPILEQSGASPKTYSLRDIFDAILYQARAGCAWRMLPHDLPSPRATFYYFQRWTEDGTWERLHEALRKQVRVADGRDEEPSAAILDSQSAKTTEQGGTKGYDAGKKVKGRKRHLLVDTLGLLIALVVLPANIQDSEAAHHVVNAELLKEHPRLEKLWVDGGYQSFVKQTRDTLPLDVELVKRSDAAAEWREQDAPPPTKTMGFKVLPHRWIVERTFGWWNRWRGLAKDYEATVEATEAKVRVVMSALMVRSLCG